MKKFAATIALFFLVSDAFAQGAATSPVIGAIGLNSGAQLLFGTLSPNANEETFLRNVSNLFGQLDADADGVLTSEDIARHQASILAALKAQAAVALMRYDLDGDGVVTVDEVTSQVRYEMRARIASVNNKDNAAPATLGNALVDVTKEISERVEKLMAADTNKDGRITYEEAANAGNPPTLSSQLVENFPARIMQLQTLNPGGTGSLTLTFVQSAARTIFYLVDANHDGRVTPEELNEYRARPRLP